jgi:PST family polysaccharide transporter/lipopolysaccharide exporter
LSLSARVFKGGIWVSFAFAFSRLLGLLRLAVLTHLLLPTDFGLITIVTLIVSSMWVLSDAGMSASVVQKIKPSALFLHTVWHINWLRGFSLAILCWLCAPWAAIFFEHPEIKSLLRWAALIPLIQGFESLGTVLLKKELNFKKRTYIDFLRETVQTIVSIVLVVYWQASATSIVWGIIAGVASATVLSYFLHTYRPVWVFSKACALEIWHYGSHLMGAGILVFAMTNLDDVVVSKILGIEQLGYYGVAFTLAAILTNQLVQVFNTVMFPALSQIQVDTQRIQNVLNLSARLMAGTLTPVVCFVFLFPEQLIAFFLSEKWVPAADVLVVLLLMGWFRGIATVFGPILMARKQTAALHKIKWMEFALFMPTLIPAVYFFGLVGAATVLLLVYVLSLILHMLAVNKELLGGARATVIQIVHGATPAVLAWIVATVVLTSFPQVALLLIGILYLSVWFILGWIREKVFVHKLIQMVKQ